MLVNEKFLEIYQQIEFEIRENYPEIITPGQNIVVSLAALDKFKSREDFLFALRNIRNTLSHTKQINGQDVITVNECLILFAENVLKELREPKLVECDKKYKTVSLDDTVDIALKLVKTKRIVPVVDNKKQIIGIITPKEMVDILCSKKYSATAQISEFKKHIKTDGIVFRQTSVTERELQVIIDEHLLLGEKICAVIITENGTKTGKLVGIVKNDSLF